MDAYSGFSKLDLRTMGWQFLRRSPAYISDWHAWKALHAREAARQGVSRDELQLASQVLCDRYALARTQHPPDPALDILPAVEGDATRGARLIRVQTGGWIEDFDAPDTGDFLDIRLFADGSVSDQLEAVKLRLLALRKSLGLPSRPKIDIRPRAGLIKYLRILDAKAAWTPSDEIYATLYPRLSREQAQKALHKNFQAAKKLSQSGYRSLLWASIPQ